MSPAHTTLGAYLRHGRERSGLSLEAVSAGSRVVPRLVEALEGDRADLLPAPVYVRGFIRAYCEQVGTDVDEALRLYDAQAIPDPPLTVAPTPSKAPSPARRWGPIAVGSLLVVILGIAGVFLLGRRQPDAGASRGGSETTTVAHASAPAERPAAPDASAPPALAPTPNAPAPAASQPVSAMPAPGQPGRGERVLLVRAVDTTWIRVQPDGAKATEETLAPGAVREWRSPGRFHVTLGNAGGVELELDGQALPALGAPGQVVRDAVVPGEPAP